jgi:serine/threonine protein kinase
MATVYLARDLKHDRPVAFKLFRPEAALNIDAQRFRGEIATAARLQHPTFSRSSTLARPMASSDSPCRTFAASRFGSGFGAKADC